jgi:tetratricopeptide (TPR) repeat protein
VDILPPRQYEEKVFGAPYKEKYPIYFSVTVQEDNLMDLQPHLRMEGFVYRVVPENTWNKQPDVARTEHNLYNVYTYASIYDPGVFKDENTSNLLRNYASSHFQLGVAFRRHNQPEKALREFQKAERIAPDEPANLNLLGISYAELGQFPQALDYFRKLLADQPNYSYTYEQIGRVFLALGQRDSAEVYLNRGLMVDPNYPNIYLTLYQLYRQEGDTSRALHILETWRKGHPYDSTVIQEIQQYRREIAAGRVKPETALVKFPAMGVQIR